MSFLILRRLILKRHIHNQEIMISCGQKKNARIQQSRIFEESDMTIVIINDDDVHWFISIAICIIVS